jgi:hypothetical protein
MVLLTFRQICGYEKVVFYSKAAFAVLFLSFRVFFFGMGVWRFLGLWVFRPDVIDKFVLNHVPEVVFFSMLMSPLLIPGLSAVILI